MMMFISPGREKKPIRTVMGDLNDKIGKKDKDKQFGNYGIGTRNEKQHKPIEARSHSIIKIFYKKRL